MGNSRFIVAVIPARGGSKRIPQKNVIEIAGKPLIGYSIEAANKCKYIKKVLVSTDNEEIARIAKSFGAEVPFLRPKELARDDTPSLPVIQHAIRYIENAERLKVDIVVLLQPTSPIRSEKYIDETIEKLIYTEADSAVTVCKIKHHPFWSFIANEDKLSPFSKEGINLKHEDLPPVYSLNGSVYAVRRDVLLVRNSIFGNDTRAVVMPQEESVDVDDFFDLFMAEMVMKYWKNWIKEKQKLKKETN
jgi:N-acylneuraminate cytidylyltransferase/CMP-N,N'-diacetyllegionaminic acid synthase